LAKNERKKVCLTRKKNEVGTQEERQKRVPSVTRAYIVVWTSKVGGRKSRIQVPEGGEI